MKTEFKSKFLQHMIAKKRNNEGFTLIELLVVIIIIGILAAIALPSFLNQASKAKQSEAKNTISSVNSAQTAYRTENGSFASSMSQLGLGLPTATSNYTYTMTADTTNDAATIQAKAGDASVKGYSGGSKQYTTNSQSAISSVVCEALTPGKGDPAAPTVSTAGSGPTCVTSSTKPL